MDGGLSWGWRALSWPSCPAHCWACWGPLLLSMSPENLIRSPFGARLMLGSREDSGSKQVGPHLGSD